MTRWFTAITAAFVLAVSPTRAETVIKLATFAPVNSAYHDVLLELAREWRDISKGEVVLRIYSGGVAGDDPDVVRKMRIGQLQAAILILGGLPDIDPRFRAFQMPMMYRDNAEFDHVLRAMRPTLDRLLAQHSFRGLAWADGGWLHIFSRAPVVTPDDLRRQRVFIFAGASPLAEALRDCGFRPVELPATDIHTALQSGMLDAVSAPPLGALSMQWFAQIPHMSTLRWVPLMAGFVITERAWRALPERIRPQLAAATERAAARMRTEVRGDADKAVAVMRDHGLAVHEVPAAEVEIWRGEVSRCFAPLIGDYIDGRLVRQIEETLRAYRASR
jgi:TRAP-type C4-dicarboxylate transport system substrate-binding protein